MASEQQNITVDGRKVTWGYTRKQNLGNYESEEVSVYVSDVVPEDADNIIEWAQNQSEAALAAIKAEVWAGLGLEFSFQPDGTPVLDKPKPKRPVEASQPAQAGPGSPPPVQNSGRKSKDQPSMAQVGYYAEFPGFCKECGARGIESFYDNRQDVDQRIGQGRTVGPDFKCKQCENAIWRPGSYDYNQAVKGNKTQQQAAPPPVEPPY